MPLLWCNGNDDIETDMADRQSPAKQGLDDWEEVADNYSILSLSSSDDEVDDTPAALSSKPPHDPPPDYTENRRKKTPDTLVEHPQTARGQCLSSEAAGEASSLTEAQQNNNLIDLGSASPAPLEGSGTSSPSASCKFRRKPPAGKATGIDEAVTTDSPRNGDKMEMETFKDVEISCQNKSTEADGASDGHSKLFDWLGRPIRRQSSSLPLPSTSNEAHRVTIGSTYKPSTESKMEEAAGEFDSLKINADPPEEEEELGKPEATLGETLDLDDSLMDPVCISKTLGSLYDYIADTLRRTTEELAGLNESLNVGSSCNALMGQINELRPILAEYAIQWEKSAGAREIPLDPSLSLWLSSLEAIISKLRRKSRRWSRHANTEEGKKVHSALLQLDAALDNHIKQMNDFLPIIQVDYNDYRTQNMPFPIDEIDDECKSPRHGGNIPPRPTDRLSQVRNAMYSLKDQLQKTVEVLAIGQNFLSEPACATASDIVVRLGSTINAASLALTNNGSEWLESDLGRAQIGLLSHAEFSNLDPKTLHEFKVRLQQICNLLSNPADHKQWTDEMVRGHHVYMLVEQQQLDALGNIASVLQDLMMPKHLKTKTEFDDFLKEM